MRYADFLTEYYETSRRLAQAVATADYERAQWLLDHRYNLMLVAARCAFLPD